MPLLRRLLIIVMLLALAVIGGAGYLYLTGENAGTGGGTAEFGGAFELVNTEGETVTEADFQGGYQLIYFGYTYCPDVCPTALSTMSRALDRFAERDAAAARKVTPVFITVDPGRDTVEVMRSYVQHFHPRLIGLTGTAEQVRQAAKAYRVYYAKVEDAGSSEYLMDHSSYVYLMGPQGRLLTHFTHRDSPEAIAEGLAAYVPS